MKTRLLWLLPLLLILFQSCRKNRDADFTVNKNEIFLGEAITVTPQYENVDNFKWDFGDNSSEKKGETQDPYLFKAEGLYTITMTASHKRSFKKSISTSKEVRVRSWTIDSLQVIAIPDLSGWDSNSGPDMILKLNDPKVQFQNIFTSDHTVHFPYDLDSTQMPFTQRNIDFRLYYTDWEFRLLDEDLPLTNQLMHTWNFNPYLKGSSGSFDINDGGYHIRFFYGVNE